MPPPSPFARASSWRCSSQCPRARVHRETRLRTGNHRPLIMTPLRCRRATRATTIGRQRSGRPSARRMVAASPPPLPPLSPPRHQARSQLQQRPCQGEWQRMAMPPPPRLRQIQARQAAGRRAVSAASRTMKPAATEVAHHPPLLRRHHPHPHPPPPPPPPRIPLPSTA
jgi:hypothetical protein